MLDLKICACGCKREFQPKRKDQIYLDSKHANYGYNHGKRKTKNLIKKEVMSKLNKNENVLKQLYQLTVEQDSTIPFVYLTKLDFDEKVFRSCFTANEENYFFMYEYGIKVNQDNEVKIFKI